MIAKHIIEQQVLLALQEDIGTGDVTASLIDKTLEKKAQVIVREEAIICGIAWFNQVFHYLDENIQITWHIQEGQEVNKNTILCEIQGLAHILVTGERTALNFLQFLSGIATKTRFYIKSIQHTQTRILDTRKTIPGLRIAEKYAVRCGGGVNHRIGLYDAILLKENHIMAGNGIKDLFIKAQTNHPNIPIIIEVETVEELEQAIELRPYRILLDNFNLMQLKQAVLINKQQVPLEASGGVNSKTIKDIAETGIDFVSIGDITKNIQSIDLSMRFL